MKQILIGSVTYGSLNSSRLLPSHNIIQNNINIYSIIIKAVLSFRVLNDRWALERANSNVERYYPVVGVLEELNSTLTVLEKRLPYFFRGVKDIYFKQLLGKVFSADLFCHRKVYHTKELVKLESLSYIKCLSI